MSVKVFDVRQAKNIEPEIQRWLDTHPGIHIEAMSQSSAYDNSGWYYQIIIIYR